MSIIPKKRFVTIIFNIIVLVICCRYILVHFQWRGILNVLGNANHVWLFAGGCLSILLYWVLRTLRWLILLRRLDLDVDFPSVYLCSAVSASFSIITPFQSGELVKVEILRKIGGIDRFQGYSSFVVERFFDFLVVVFLAITSIAWKFRILHLPMLPEYIFTVLLAIFVLAVTVILLSCLRFKEIIVRFMKLLLRYLNDPKSMLAALLLTVLSWATVALGWYVMLLSCGLQVDYMHSVAMMSVVTVISILSMIPGGVGIAEVSITEILLLLGQSSESAQAGALALRLYGLLILTLGVLHLLFWKTRSLVTKVRFASVSF